MIATSPLDPATVQPLASELLARDTWSRQELLEHQRREVSATLRHAVAASSYYREVLGAAVAENAELPDLPTLSKRVLMEQ
jgi:phenylacetate-coenzyme A ligase PaaK-like adenylate-forming protein